MLCSTIFVDSFQGPLLLGHTVEKINQQELCCPFVFLKEQWLQQAQTTCLQLISCVHVFASIFHLTENFKVHACRKCYSDMSILMKADEL